MNNKGFIATSLLYSFFLLFCAIILAYAASLAHNSLLLNKEVDMINDDLHTNKILSNTKVGEYFRLNLCISEDKKAFFESVDTLNYIYIGNRNGNSTLISNEINYKVSNLELLNLFLNDIYVKNGLMTYISRSMSYDDYNMIKTNYDILNNDNYYLIANNPSNYYSGSYYYDSSSKTLKNYSTSTTIYLRLSFDILPNTRIIGGNGTLSSPYILEGGAVSC